MSMLARFGQIIQRFRRERDAVAAVEFALIAPFLLMLYLGSMEAGALFSVDRRINSISATIGDLVSQWNPVDKDTGTGSCPGRPTDVCLKTSTITDYMNASTGILSPYPTTGIKIVVSLVKVNKTTGATTVLWSKANAGATARGENTSYSDLAASQEMNKIARGGCIIAAEATYSYLPLLGQFFTSPLTLRHTNYFLPRYGNSLPIELDTKALDDNACTV